jgi:hypothetical protein
MHQSSHTVTQMDLADAPPPRSTGRVQQPGIKFISANEGNNTFQHRCNDNVGELQLHRSHTSHLCTLLQHASTQSCAESTCSSSSKLELVYKCHHVIVQQLRLLPGSKVSTLRGTAVWLWQWDESGSRSGARM